MWKKTGNPPTCHSREGGNPDPQKNVRSHHVPFITAILAIILLTSTVIQAADNILIQATIDKQSVPINDVLTLTLSVDGSQNIPGLNLPALSDFDVLGQSTSTQIQIINGTQSASKSYIFTLKPKKKGEAHIPAIQWKAENGSIYRTNPIVVTITDFVTPNANQNRSQRRGSLDDFFSDDFFNQMGNPFHRSHLQQMPPQEIVLQCAPEKSTLYVGEKTILQMKLIFERPFSQGPAIQFPDLKGFIASPAPKTLSADMLKQIKYKGKNENLIEVSRTIYAPAPGTPKIDPLQIQYVDTPFDSVQTKSTQACSIKVLPLPAPEPAHFSGAVGQFTLKLAPITQKIKSNQAVPVEIILEGQGNADMVNELSMPGIDGVSWFLDHINDKLTAGLTIQRKFTYFFTALSTGNLDLGTISFGYFNPTRKTYETAKLTFPKITVTQGDTQNVTTSNGQNSQSNSLNISKNAIDIRLDKSILIKAQTLTKKAIIAVTAIGVISLLILLIYRIRQAPLRRLKNDIAALHHQKNPNPQAFLNDIYTALTRLVKIKYHLNLSGLTNKVITEKIKEELQAKALINLIAKYEEHRYAAAQLTPETQKELIEIIERLAHS